MPHKHSATEAGMKQRPSGTESGNRITLSVGPETNIKVFPDALRVCKDVRDQLKLVTLPYPLKNNINISTKDAEILMSCNKAISPYLRRTLVDLRMAVKQTGMNETEKVALVRKMSEAFASQLEKVRKKEYQIVEAAEAKKVASNKTKKIFQVYIEDNVRICSVDQTIDLAGKMNDAQKLQRLIKDTAKVGNTRAFSIKLKDELNDITQSLLNMMALDGMSAMKSRQDVINLRSALVKEPENEDEAWHRIKEIKANINPLTNNCELKRDRAETHINDVTKLMLEMDQSINDKNEMLRSQNVKKEAKKNKFS